MANVQQFGKLLGSDAARVEAVLDDLTALAANVGNQPFGPLAKELAFKPGSVPVFRDQSLTVAASAAGSLQIHAPDHEARAFDLPADADGFTAPAGRSFAELALDGRFDVEGQASVQLTRLLTLSLGLKAGAQLQYRHLLPVRADRPRLEGLKNVVTGSRLPQLAGFKDLAPGEVHELTATAYLDLRASIGLEGDASFVGALFEGLPSEVNIHVQYVAEASLGLALYEGMTITAGKALLLDPSRVRLRVSRESRRRLTLGARLALEVQYDLTQGLESLLEQALDLLPLPRSVETLRQVRDIAGQIGAGNWDQIKQTLSTQAGQKVTELLGDAGWLAWTQTSPEVAKFLAFSRKAVEAYDSLDDKLQSLWDRLLGKADLGPGSNARTLLERLSQIDPQHPELLVSDPEKRELIAAVEILGGQSLEEILLASGASQSLAQVKALAQQALRFLTDVPKDFFDTLQGFAQRTGIEKAVAWLRDNATSADQIRTAAETHVQKLVAQLAGKALDQISDADVKKIQKWAEKLHQVLMAPDVIEQKLRDRIARLKGQAGLSVAVEIDRVSRTTALLDIEFDPANDEVRKAVEKVGLRDLGGVLRELPEGNPDQEDTLPYQLRECVFTSERTRTSSINLFFSWLGWTKGSRRRIEESTVRVLPTLRREAVYSGAAVLSSESQGAQFSGAVWLTSRAEGPGKDIGAPYATASREIRLTYSREDAKSSAEELDILGILLNDLGFNALQPNHPRSAVLGAGTAAAPATRFSIDVRLPAQAADSFFQGFNGSGATDLWLFDLLNGLHRWFNERLVPEKVQIEGQMRPTRSVLSRALFHAEVRKAWLKGRQDLNDFARATPVVLRIEDENVNVRLADNVNGTAVWKTLVVLPISRDHAGNGLKALRKTEQRLAAGGLRPEDLSALSRDAAKALNAFQPHPTFWGNTLLGFWTVVSRLSQRDPAALAQATGLATLRWQDAAGKWASENIHTWQLTPGAMVHDRVSGTGMFPIIK
jgi:hypothetical protein